MENLRRIFSGPFGTLEETFFSRFRYEEFGFHSTLKNGKLMLEGVRRADAIDYLMYSKWYQFPRISIINNMPDRRHDWSSILRRIQRIQRSSF